MQSVVKSLDGRPTPFNDLKKIRQETLAHREVWLSSKGRQRQD